MGDIEKTSRQPNAPYGEPGAGIQVDQEDAPGPRFGAGIPKWAGLLGAVLAIAFISLVPNLVGDTPETEDEPEPPTVITLPAPVVDDIPPLATETSLGVFEWTKLVGNQKDIPLGDIYINPFGEGYLSYSDESVWLSPDGESWTIVYGASFFRHFSWTTITGRWALAYTPDNQMFAQLDGFEVFQMGDARWEPVQLPDPILPQIEGMRFRKSLGQPVESESVVLIPFSASGSVPWENYYRPTPVQCGKPTLCEIGPETWWDPTTQTLVVSSFNGYIAIEVSHAVEVKGNRIVFTDATTGETIHTLIFEEPGDAASYTDLIRTNQALEISGVWASSNGGVFSSHEVPWARPGPMLAVPEGGFAAYEGLHSHQPANPPEQTLIWTSTDGISWEDRGTPGFVSGPFDQIEVVEAGPQLLATLYRGNSINHWLSTDGVTWVERGPTSLPPWAAISPTDFGFVAMDFSRGERHRFWISADGENWEAIRGPTSPPASLVSRPYGVAGELLFHATPGAEGARILWIGRLVPS